MKKKISSFYLIFTTAMLGIAHLSSAFAKKVTDHLPGLPSVHDSAKKVFSDSSNIISPVKSIYDSLHLNLAGLSQQAFDYAKEGFSKLFEEGKLSNHSIISVIDFSQPSNKKRLFVLDLKNYKVLFNTLVAHGKNTGKQFATSFSNQPESLKSSPGFYITRETYEGKNGYSLKLEGVERGVNDNAYERGIVIHGADYVNQDLANAQGYIGRSWGCPALPLQVNNRIINTIKNGTCLFIYHPSYINKSVVLR